MQYSPWGHREPDIRAVTKNAYMPYSVCVYITHTQTHTHIHAMGFPGGSGKEYSAGKDSACSVGDLGSTPGLRRSPGEGNGNPLQYFFLENSMDRGAWWATVHGIAKSWT